MPRTPKRSPELLLLDAILFAVFAGCAGIALYPYVAPLLAQ